MKIFIAGISYNLSNADLGELFEEFGEVISAKIVMDRETGRSKGFGFVEMPNDEEGNAAIAALNEKEIDGKTLAVSVARPREEGPRRNSNYGGGNRGGYGNNRGGGYGGGNRGGGYGGGRDRYYSNKITCLSKQTYRGDARDLFRASFFMIFVATPFPCI